MRATTANIMEPFAERGPFDADMFDDCYPWDMGQDAAIRNTRVVDPARFGYPLQQENEVLLVELSTVVGHEGTDWQNPYAWQARGVLAYPSPYVPPPGGLQPNYAVNAAMTPEQVQMNVIAGSGILDV